LKIVANAGLRTRNLDVKALQAIFELLQSHYPERLSALWFLNAPFIFWGVWRLVTSHPSCLRMGWLSTAVLLLLDKNFVEGNLVCEPLRVCGHHVGAAIHPHG
jgi:hypothetical protein